MLYHVVLTFCEAPFSPGFEHLGDDTVEKLEPDRECFDTMHADQTGSVLYP